MSPPGPAVEPAALPIALVERETGLSKDTLRVWEKRYGFPRPWRDAYGDRRYPAAQVQQLQLIRRLIDAGQRPGKIVGLDEASLQALVKRLEPPESLVLSRTNEEDPVDQTVALASLMGAIGVHDPAALRHALSHAQVRMGLSAFVTDLVAPLTKAVGEAWAQGRFEIFEEHLYTEVIGYVLRNAISSIAPPAASRGPRVLLTTLPQEPHGLGLLMVEALLALEGCTCVSLGTQTPIAHVDQAARAHGADVVALSFTNVHRGSARVLASLRELRDRLPKGTALWVGGSCTALYQKPLDGITAVQPLTALPSLVAHWRNDPANRSPGPGGISP